MTPKRMLKTALLALGLLVAAVAQTENDTCRAPYSCYAALKETASAETLTVQQVFAPEHRNVEFRYATVYCAAACNFTLSQNGTAATTTTLATTVIQGSTSSALAFSASNVGAGTAIAKYYLNDGQTITLDLKGMHLQPSTASNLTIATSTIVGTVRIQFYWRESQ